MIKIAILFVVVAVVLAVLSFGGLVVGAALGILKILFWIAAAIAIVLFVLGLHGLPRSYLSAAPARDRTRPQTLSALGDTFWLLPGAAVIVGIIAGVGMVAVDRSGIVPQWLIDSPWLYNGGATGARTLLGAVASSTIGVAGTVFSITIAALSLAAGQMGPRLLRNFTRDRGNQLTLGTFLGTFSYALMVLRSVRTQSEGLFVPHLSLSIGILLAFVCVGTLVFFVGHMAGRINVDTVVDLVSDEVRRHPAPDAGRGAACAAAAAFWHGATAVTDTRRGYLQQLDEDRLADWAATHGTAIRLLVRPGDYVFPGAAIAALTQPVEGAERPSGTTRRWATSAPAPATWSSPSGSWSRWRSAPSRPASTIRTRR